MIYYSCLFTYLLTDLNKLFVIYPCGKNKMVPMNDYKSLYIFTL